mgnify:CR=1 FL=1
MPFSAPDFLAYFTPDVRARIAERGFAPGQRLFLRGDRPRFMFYVASGEAPSAEVAVAYRGLLEKAEAAGDGGYDAFMNALKKAVRPLELELPALTDYRVRIPPGGRTGALVETTITWKVETSSPASRRLVGETFTTLGVDSDQLAAAVIATEKMLNAIVSRRGSEPERKPARERRRAEDGGARASG